MLRRLWRRAIAVPLEQRLLVPGLHYQAHWTNGTDLSFPKPRISLSTRQSDLGVGRKRALGGVSALATGSLSPGVLLQLVDLSEGLIHLLVVSLQAAPVAAVSWPVRRAPLDDDVLWLILHDLGNEREVEGRRHWASALPVATACLVALCIGRLHVDVGPRAAGRWVRAQVSLLLGTPLNRPLLLRVRGLQSSFLEPLRRSWAYRGLSSLIGAEAGRRTLLRRRRGVDFRDADDLIANLITDLLVFVAVLAQLVLPLARALALPGALVAWLLPLLLLHLAPPRLPQLPLDLALSLVHLPGDELSALYRRHQQVLLLLGQEVVEVLLLCLGPLEGQVLVWNRRRQVC